MVRLFSLALALLPLMSCSQDRDLRRQELDEISAQHSLALSEFERAQAAFLRQNPMPQQLDFGADGTILVEECELQGHPGHEQLWVKYTYVNTTQRSLDAARITLTLSEPEGGVEWDEEVELSLPLGFRFGPDSSYTTHFQVSTRGIHLHPDWGWKIRARALVRRAGA